MTSDEYYARPKLRTGLTIKASDELGMTSSCISCVHFNEPTEICKLFKARPPAKVIAFGCRHYNDSDEIPF